MHWQLQSLVYRPAVHKCWSSPHTPGSCAGKAGAYRSSGLAAGSAGASPSSPGCLLSPAWNAWSSGKESQGEKVKMGVSPLTTTPLAHSLAAFRTAPVSPPLTSSQTAPEISRAQLTSFFKASRMRVFSCPRLSLILARRRFSMIGLEDWRERKQKQREIDLPPFYMTISLLHTWISPAGQGRLLCLLLRVNGILPRSLTANH